MPHTAAALPPSALGTEGTLTISVVTGEFGTRIYLGDSATYHTASGLKFGGVDITQILIDAGLADAVEQLYVHDSALSQEQIGQLMSEIASVPGTRNGNLGPAGTGRADDAPPQGIKPHRFSVFLSGLPRDSVRRPFLHPHNAPTLPEADTSSFPPLKNDVQGSLRLKRFTGRPCHPTFRTNPFPPRRNSRNRIRKKPSSLCGRRASSLQPSYPCAERPFRLCREQHTPTFREGRLFQAAPSA